MNSPEASGERYLSGTEWEYEDALNAAGSLDLLIYRRTGVPLLRYGDPERVEKQRQLDLVERFFEKFRAPDGSLLRLFTLYDEPADFEKLLADDLERLLRLHLDADDAKRALRLRQREEELAERERMLRKRDREATVDALVAEAKTPEASVTIATALQELTAGNATRAKAVFAEVLDRKAAESSAAAREAAAAARHLGTLAMLDDTLEALRAFRRASELDPTDTWTWIHISRLETQKGDLKAAEAASRQARLAAERAGNERDVAVADHEQGDVLVGQGRLADALKAFEAYRAIAERLVASDPGNAGWQRDLSVSHNKIGDVQRAQGDLTAALASYQASLTIRERLARADPGNAGWQRDLSVSHNKIGDVQRAQGDLTAALASYQASHAIAEHLAASDPGNAGWQRDLAFSHWRLARLWPFWKFGSKIKHLADLAKRY